MSSHRKPPPPRAAWGARGAELARSPRVGGGLFLAGTVVAVVAMASMTPDTGDDVASSRIVPPLAAQPGPIDTTPPASESGSGGGSGTESDGQASTTEEGAQSDAGGQQDGRIVAGSGRGSTDSSSGARRTLQGGGTDEPKASTTPSTESSEPVQPGASGTLGVTDPVTPLATAPDGASGTPSGTPKATGQGDDRQASAPRSTTDATERENSGRGPLLAAGDADREPPALASTDVGDILRPPTYDLGFDSSAELPPMTVTPPAAAPAPAKPTPTPSKAAPSTATPSKPTPSTPAPTVSEPATPPVTSAPAVTAKPGLTVKPGLTAEPEATATPTVAGTTPAPVDETPREFPAGPRPQPESTGPDAGGAGAEPAGGPTDEAASSGEPGPDGTVDEQGTGSTSPAPEPTGTDSSHSVPRPDQLPATPVASPAVPTPVATEAPTTAAPAPPAPEVPLPPAPAPTAVITGVAPGDPAVVTGDRSGTPVVVTGTALDAADFWTVGGQRVEPVEVTGERAVLIVPPGAADGQVAAGEATGALDLGDVVPGMLAAAPLVWGVDCAEPAQTGLIWVAGTGLGSGAVTADGTKRAGQPLADGTLVVPTGTTVPERVAVTRDGWTTIVPVQDAAVDVSGVARLPGLKGDDCPMSEGTSRIGLVTTNQATALKGVYTADRTPLRFVPISETAIAVLLPRGEDAGTRTVKVLKNNGNMWERPLQVVRPEDVTADGKDVGTLLAGQVVQRSVP